MKKLQWCVEVQREGCRVKRKEFATEKAARRRMALLGPEPWAAYGKRPDDPACCLDNDCCCSGQSIRDYEQERRESLPKLIYAKLMVREVSPWLVVPHEPEPPRTAP